MRDDGFPKKLRRYHRQRLWHFSGGYSENVPLAACEDDRCYFLWLRIQTGGSPSVGLIRSLRQIGTECFNNGPVDADIDDVIQ